MYKRILVPLDGSELAEQVLPQVIDLANCTGAEIVLLRVPDAPIYDYLMTAPDWSVTVREQARTDTANYLETLSAQLRAMGLNVLTRADYGGAVYSTILDTANEMRVDLIAMSTHGRGGLARMVMGSVADDVLRHTCLPVLMLRPKTVREHQVTQFKNGAVVS